LEKAIGLFRTQLFYAFYGWLEANKDAIGKWYDQLHKRAKDAENITTNAIAIMGTSMWMFNMIANCGVMAGIGPDKVSIHQLDPRLDEKTTKRLLLLISACMNLQYLPPEIAKQEIPIISSKKFSLKLWVQERRIKS